MPDNHLFTPFLPQDSPQTADFNYLNTLNDVQRAAVETTEGPVMIVAGPGSGKTRVLTFRIAHLINIGKAPHSILALTFTNKAAREMKERITNIVGEKSATQLWMGTFHAVFARILRAEAEHIGFPSNFTIYDTEDAKNLIKTILKEQNLSDEQYKPGQVLHRISYAKNNLITPEAYAKDEYIQATDIAGGRPHIANLYRIYYRRCRQANAMDFDDLLIKMYLLLFKHSEVYFKYRNKFKYILIDEFQDTNKAQYTIVRRLADAHKNIAVVGDDAQSIYAFRGATIENILNFERDYGPSGLHIFKLEQNYRSTKRIVEIANAVISANPRQIAKQIWTDNEQGSKVRLISAASDSEEAKIIADLIYEDRLRLHLKNEDIAILYRTNAQSRPIEEALRKNGIPYRVYGGLSFYQRKEIKDMMAYLRLTVNPFDEEALKRVINYPARNIGETTLQKMGQIAAAAGISLWEVATHIDQTTGIQPKQKAAIWNFVQLIHSFAEKLKTADAYELARLIGSETRLVSELYSDKSVEGLSRYENLQELFNSIKEFTDNKRELASDPDDPSGNNDNTLGAYLQEVSLLTDMDDDKDDSEVSGGRVKMMTVHAAKGLEFGAVFLTGLEEGLFPSQLSLRSEQEIEEERRLFYVGVTRAEKNLTLSHALCRYKFGNLQYSQPGRFLSEIPAEHLDSMGLNTQISSPDNFIFDSDKKEKVNIQSNINSIKKQQQGNPLNSNAPSLLSTEQLANFKPSPPAALKEGVTVLHQRFGKGKVLLVEGTGEKKMAHIKFDAHGEKRIMLKFSPLMVI